MCYASCIEQYLGKLIDLIVDTWVLLVNKLIVLIYEI